MLDTMNLFTQHLSIVISLLTIIFVALIGWVNIRSQRKANKKNEMQTENAAYFSGSVWDFITAVAMIWPAVAAVVTLVFPGTAKNLVAKIDKDLGAILQSVEQTEEKTNETWKIEVVKSIQGDFIGTATCGKSPYQWSSIAYTTGYELEAVQTLFDENGNILPITDEVGDVYKSVTEKLTAAPKTDSFSTNELPYKMCTTLKLDGEIIVMRAFVTWAASPSIDSCAGGETITIYPRHVGMSILGPEEAC